MVYELTIDRLKGSRRRVEIFIDNNLQQWVETLGVPIVKANGFKKGLSSDAISYIHAEKTGYMKSNIRWGLKTPDGKPLDLFLEEGTSPHDIEAKFAKFLSWINDQGIRVFRKKVKHPGTTAMNIFKDSKQDVEKIIQEKTEYETTRYLDAMRVQ